ncbi:MAG: sensor histidine kinase [Acidimicrobiales bacterium]
MDPAPDPQTSRSIAVLVLDLAAAIVLATIGVSELRSVGDDIFYRSADVLGVTLILLQTLPLVARRFVPVTVTLLISVAGATMLWLGYPGTNALLAVPLALYSVGASRSRRGNVVVTGMALAILVPPLALSPAGSSSSVIVAAATFAVGAFAGGGVRVRRLYAEALEVQARQAENERRLEAREAVVEERTRIARELHDAIGHTVNVMVMQAGAGRMAAAVDPARTVDALVAIEDVGRATLGDIDRLLGLLRDDDDEAPRAPATGLRDLDALAGRLSSAGLDVTLDVSGDVASVPSPVSSATYRIVQEALTNALKYAGSHHVDARVTVTATDVNIDVVDDGPGPAADVTDNERRGGRGLIGMRERVATLGGEIDAGPGPDGGFVVRARIPLDREGASA